MYFKCVFHLTFGPLLEDELGKMCTRLWQEICWQKKGGSKQRRIYTRISSPKWRRFDDGASVLCGIASVARRKALVMA
jgi:hypothetical protein